MRELDDLLEVSAWWPTLTAEQRQRARASIRVVDVGASGLVVDRGDPVRSWIGVVDGLVSLCNTDRRGKTVVLAGIVRGGWFGEGSVLKNEPRRFQAYATRDCRIAHMPSDVFLWLLDNNIGFNRFVILQLNERLGFFISALESQRLLSPEGRLARCIAQFFNPQLYPASDSQLNFTQLELGMLSGLSRQRVNQALRVLEDSGLIEVRYGAVSVVSVDGLMHYGEA
ncbi:MAG: Crp/Fnr family transcriptional regulator [Burkholderiaceae bacterium]